MSLAARIAKNTIYQIGGKAGGIIIGLITVGLMTRYLGQTGFGYYTTIVTFLQFFSVIIDFGLQMTTTQLLAKDEAEQEKNFANIFALRLISAIIFLGLAVAVIWLTPYPTIIKQGASVASASFFFIALQSVLISVFQKHLTMAKVATAEIWGRAVLLLGTWLAIKSDLGLLYIIAAVVVGSGVNFFILFFGAKKYLKLRLRFDFTVWKKIWQRSWPLGATIALTLVYFRADTLIMSFFRPQNEVGIYGATYKVLEILIQFPYLFLGLILPLLTKFFVDNKTLFAVTLQKSFDFLAIITLPMIGASIVLGEKIMVFVAGPAFIVSGDILKLIIFAAGIIYFSALFGYAIVACELQKKMLPFYLIDALISLPLYLIFIPKYSYWAAAAITILTEFIILISSYYIARRHIGINIKYKIFGKAIIATVVMAMALTLLYRLNLAALIIIGLIVYFWVLYLLRGVTKETVTELIKLK